MVRSAAEAVSRTSVGVVWVEKFLVNAPLVTRVERTALKAADGYAAMEMGFKVGTYPTVEASERARDCLVVPVGGAALRGSRPKPRFRGPQASDVQRW